MLLSNKKSTTIYTSDDNDDDDDDDNDSDNDGYTITLMSFGRDVCNHGGMTISEQSTYHITYITYTVYKHIRNSNMREKNVNK